MSLLSSLFSSSKKQNLTPDISYKMPSQINPEMYASLSSLAKNYQNGVGTGFGPDFVNNATNPVASSMRRNFQNVTSPFLSSQYSSRGLGNSSLAANAQGVAQGNVESDIGNLMAQFQTLNEQQKKTDQQFGANLGQNILSGDVAAQGNQAAASQHLADATAQNALTRQSIDQQRAGGLMQAGAQLINPMGGALSSLGLSSLGGGMQSFGNSFNNQSASAQLLKMYQDLYSPKTNIAGSR